MITIDGVSWTIPCDITRTAEIKPSEISGLLLNKTYFNDVLGIYMNYEISLVANPASMADYYAIYEIITQPVGEHTFVFPYNGSTITVVGRVEEISDVYVRLPNGATYWKGISFEVTANEPSKT